MFYVFILSTDFPCTVKYATVIMLADLTFSEAAHTDEKSSYEFNCSSKWISCPPLCVRYC